MTEQTAAPAFSEAEIGAQAQLNARLLVLLVIAYAKDRGQSPTDALRSLCEIVAPGWDDFRAQGAFAVARNTALNLASIGATVERLTGDGAQAETTLAGWPLAADLALCGLRREEADALFACWNVFTDRLGLDYDWRREGERVTMRFAQRAAT